MDRVSSWVESVSRAQGTEAASGGGGAPPRRRHGYADARYDSKRNYSRPLPSKRVKQPTRTPPKPHLPRPAPSEDIVGLRLPSALRPPTAARPARGSIHDRRGDGGQRDNPEGRPRPRPYAKMTGLSSSKRKRREVVAHRDDIITMSAPRRKRPAPCEPVSRPDFTARRHLRDDYDSYDRRPRHIQEGESKLMNAFFRMKI